MASKTKVIERVISALDLFVIDKARRIRSEKSISQVSLSQSMGLADGAVGKIENPNLNSKYNLRHINLLAEALGCSPKDLMPDKFLPNDLIRIKIKIVRKSGSEKGLPNYEILKTTPVPRRT